MDILCFQFAVQQKTNSGIEIGPKFDSPGIEIGGFLGVII